MDSHSINQLAKFKKLMSKYGHYERVGNLCIFRSKGKATCVNIDSKYLIFDYRLTKSNTYRCLGTSLMYWFATACWST